MSITCLISFIVLLGTIIVVVLIGFKYTKSPSVSLEEILKGGICRLLCKLILCRILKPMTLTGPILAVATLGFGAWGSACAQAPRWEIIEKIVVEIFRLVEKIFLKAGVTEGV